MKQTLIILTTITMLLVGCSKEYDSLYDQSVLSELEHFEYAGYTYYVHPHLTTRTIYSRYDFDYKTILDEVKSLDSYGFSWFIPTISELEAATHSNLLRSSGVPWGTGIISSSKNDGHYLCLVYDYYPEYNYGSWQTEYVGDVVYDRYTVVPMVKFRK